MPASIGCGTRSSPVPGPQIRRQSATRNPSSAFRFLLELLHGDLCQSRHLAAGKGDVIRMVARSKKCEVEAERLVHLTPQENARRAVEIPIRFLAARLQLSQPSLGFCEAFDQPGALYPSVQSEAAVFRGSRRIRVLRRGHRCRKMLIGGEFSESFAGITVELRRRELCRGIKIRAVGQ